MMNSTEVDMVQEPFALKVVLRLFYVMVFVVGLCGNLLVCIVVVQQRRMRTVINYFTLNLALSDLIVIIIYLPSQLAAYENNQNWLLGNIGCRIIYSIVPACLSTSIATLLAISCERFRGIAFPFQPRLRLTTVRKIIILIWLTSIGTAIPLMIVAGTKSKDNKVFCDEHWSTEASSRFYWIAMFLVQYVIPLIVMTVLYGIAGWKLHRRSLFISNKRHSSINSAAEIARQRQSQKITKMLVALILLYSFCMLPQHVIYFWTVYGNFWKWKYSLYVFRISNLFPMANSALNSIAYGTLQTDFRKAYKKFFRRYNIFTCGKPNRSNSPERKRLQRYNTNRVAIKLKSAHKDALQHSLCTRNNSPKMDVENATTTKLPVTTSQQRVSSDTRSYLLLRESTSTSESVASRPDDIENRKDSQRVSQLRNGHLKMNKINENSLQPIVNPATFLQVIINGARMENTSISDTVESRFILDTDIVIEDIVLLENAKETTL